jgi:hypothetical protein
LLFVLDLPATPPAVVEHLSRGVATARPRAQRWRCSPGGTFVNKTKQKTTKTTTGDKNKKTTDS